MHITSVENPLLTKSFENYVRANDFIQKRVSPETTAFYSPQKGVAFQLENKDFLPLIDLFENKSGSTEKTPFNVQLHLTNNCNLRCKHCYQHNYTSNELNLEEIIGIVNQLFDFCKAFNFTPEFSLTGGEPLMSKNFFEILKYIKKRSRRTFVGVMTNGTLLNDKTAKKLELLGANIIQISLEASTKELNDAIRGLGVYEKVLHSIKLLKKHKLQTAMHFVATKTNASDIEPYYKLATKLGVNKVTISNLVPMGNGRRLQKEVLEPLELKEIYQKIYSLSKNKTTPTLTTSRTLWCLLDKSSGFCPVATKTITILPNGNVMPCRRLGLIVGNLRKQSFFDIWFGSKILWDLRDKDKIKVCGSCEHHDNCNGCRGMAYAIHKDYLAPDPQCWKINSSMGVLK